ncbi:diguanylate cyclase domain-containing protein [Clostridium ganghwense]|uniref:Diguanylate cyclase n=1 Tax=Clostridium ganghwense TaxID=312089 RepID=A0ABT4CM26_9CLOT|nr:diguanylate cyclase [Clostridium ganghwense]MCY6370099.1 diguanylate cyclase [Clostridium ganghwense]
MSLFNFILSLFRSKKQKVCSNRCNECNEVCCNVEKRKLVKKQLQEKEIRVKCAQKIGNLGSWEWDSKSNTLNFSDEIYEMFGINKEDFEEDFEDIMQNVIHAMIEEILIKKEDSQIIMPIEFKMVKSNREERWIRANGTSVYDDNGNRIKMIGAIQDVTEWKNAEVALQENLEFFQTLIDTIPNPIFYKDEHGVYKHCNTALAEYLGLKKEELVGHTVHEVYPKEFADIYYKADNKLMNSRGKQIYEAGLMHNDGSFHDVVFNKAALVNQQGKVKGLVGVVVDVTERNKVKKRMQTLSKLKDSMLEINQAIIGMNNINELFNLILEKAIASIDEATIGAVLVLDENKNLRIKAHKGYKLEEVKNFSIGLKRSFAWYETKGNIDKTVIINDINKIENLNILDTEEGNTIKSTISAPIIIEGQLYGFINLDSVRNYVYDETHLEIMEYMRHQIEIAISKHKLYEETIYLSRYDKLTNVYNRRYFEELIDKSIHKSRIDNKQFSFVVFDLNGLKVVNDTYGHLAGDEFIKSFTSNLSKCIGTSDILARLGGDEFVGVFFDTDSQALIKKFEELIIYFEDNPIVFKENEFICSYSYGIAKFNQDGEKYDELMRVADERMYKYKQKIKNSKEYLKSTNIL